MFRGFLRGSTLFAVVLLTVGVPAQDDGAAFEAIPKFQFNVEVNKKLRLFVYTGSQKTEDEQTYKWQIGGGANYRFKPLFGGDDEDPNEDKRHLMVFGVSYEFSRTTDNGSVKNENRITVDVTPRYQFPKKLLLTDRNRMEFRWVNGDYRFRYRNRFRMERPYKFGRFRITPFADTEAYYDQHYGRWSQFRFGGGADIPIRKRFSIEAFYERQHCVVCPASQTNILGVTFNWYWRLDKK